jgi:hypothetical protein
MMPEDVDIWAERVAIEWANEPLFKKSPKSLREFEEELGALYLNRPVNEARQIEREYWQPKGAL